jgi:tetratricopeptide (TPR) repeat protein/O-antigen ligase
MSKLANYCAGLMEASWLAAVVLLPLFFNPCADKSFEPTKLVILRSLALLVVAAWATKQLTARLAGQGALADARRSWWKSPPTVPVCLLALVYVLSTCFSIWRPYSIWGSDLLQGTYTFFSYLVLLGAVATHLRTNEQVERLVTTIILASLPACLYALEQRAGLDPISYSDAIAGRVASTFGNPNYFSAYLVVVFPLTLSRLWRLAAAVRRARSLAGRERGALLLYGAVALVQVVALVASQSRGAWLGLLVSAGLFSILLAVRPGRQRLLLVPLGLGAALSIFVLVVALPNSPLRGLRSLPLLSRFLGRDSAMDVTGGRAMVWKQAPKMMLAPGPVPVPGRGLDRYHAIRPWLGYGPETVAGVLAYRYSWAVENPVLEDRFHNLIWDLWGTIGVLGTLAFLATFISCFVAGYRLLGLLGSGRDLGLCVTLPIVFGLAGAAGLTAWLGAGYAGLGLQGGLVTGLIAYPLLFSWRRPAAISNSASNAPHAALLMGLLSALVAHFIETGFGFQLAASATLYWLYAGIILALIHLQPVTTPSAQAAGAGLSPARAKPKKPVPAATQLETWHGRQPALWAALITTTIVVALSFTFIHLYTSRALPVGEVLLHALGLQAGAKEGNSMPLFLLLVTWVASCLALTLDGALRADKPRWTGQFGLALALSGAAAGCYAVFKAWQLARIGVLPQPGTPGQFLLEQAVGYEDAYLWLMGILLGLVLLGGWIGSLRPVPDPGPWPPLGVAAGVIALLAALITSAVTNLTLMRADISVKWAEAARDRKVYPGATAVYERAAQLCPDIFHYQSRLARGLADQAEATADEAAAAELMARSEAIQLAAQQRFPFSRSAYRLGDFYLGWAARQSQPERKKALALKAGESLDHALQAEPGNPLVWCQSALVDLLLLDREEAGLRKAHKALELVPGMERALGIIADYYSRKSAAAADKQAQKQYALMAVDTYKQAIASLVAKGGSPSAYQLASGNLLLSVDDAQAALACFLDAARTVPPDVAWKVNRGLARAYLKLNNQAAARQSLQQAIKSAPASEKPGLERLATQILPP